MDTLDMIYDKVYCELDEISKKEKLDSKDVELIDKFVDIIKDIDEMGMSQDYSMTGGSYGNGGSYMRGNSTGGRSYGRGSYGRNSYGRGMYGNNGYSRDDSKDMMLNQLQNIADMAVDEKDKRAVNRLMQQMMDQN